MSCCHILFKMPWLFKNRRSNFKKLKLTVPDSNKENKPLLHSKSASSLQSQLSSSSSPSIPEVMSGSLVIPIAIWGKNPVTHCVSSILMTPDQSHIVTGCHDGHLAIWSCEENLKVSPQMILFGHTSPVTCLVMASSSDEQNYVVSSSDNGEMCLWDLSDGRCVQHNRMSVVHSHMQSHQMLQSREIRLICNGFYPEILIMHPKRLEILLTLSSNVQPDWISALCVVRPINEDENVVAVTNSGLVKVWTIPHSGIVGPQIFENESKQTRCLNAKMLKCCIYNQRTVLIVCTKYWQIYDACDFSVLCSESSRIGERWMGGEFISTHKVIVWSNRGRGYLYHLPSNTNPSSSNYRSSDQVVSAPLPYLVFDLPCDKPLDCSPVMTYILRRREGDNKLLLRGDSMGRICIWVVLGKDNPASGSVDGEARNPRIIRQTSFENLPVMKPSGTVTWCEEWNNSLPPPEGILDHLNDTATASNSIQVTSTVFMSSCCSLACGRSDGSIVIVSATQAIARQLFEDPLGGKEPLPHKLLSGHRGRVNCLLYPHNESSRYNQNHLVSGGQDFCVLLWDVSQGTKLFCFCVHGGEILQLLVPPENCNSSVLVSVCAIASDHSLSLLSLRDRKCILLASRQLFPIQVVKWRPHDDFIVIGCTDGTVYVWQMKTGHLDRVVHGVVADDILSACDEKCDAAEKLSNPTVTVTQAFRRHNIATFKHLAQQHLKKAQDAMEQKSSLDKTPHPSLIQKTQNLLPMAVQGLRSNPRDSDSHVVYFNAEALIVQLLSEEYSSLSPNTLENLGFYTKVLQDQNLSDTQKMFVDIFSKVRNKADDVSKKIQSKVDTAVKTNNSNQSLSGSSNPSSDSPGASRPDPPNTLKSQSSTAEQEVGFSSTLKICQILMSCLHAWDLDPDVDRISITKLGLLKPNRTVSFGYLSPGGHMSLRLPSAKLHPVGTSLSSKKQPETVQERFIQSSKNPFFQDQELVTPDETEVEIEQVDVKIHWQISSAVTTQHLLSIISLTNTLTAMSNSTFIKTVVQPTDKEASDKSNATQAIEEKEEKQEEIKEESSEEADINNLHQSQCKQGWSLMAALHCVLLPDLVGKMRFKPPQLEMLARRWQDRCLEIREASQALLLAELRRLGPDGRRAVVSEWSQYLPTHTDTSLAFMTSETHPGSQGGSATPNRGVQFGSTATPYGPPADEEDDDDDDGTLDGSEYLTGVPQVQRSSVGLQQHSKQATAIVMMGVVGAEFGVSIEGQRSRESTNQKETDAPAATNGNGGVADGFSVGNYAHARHTSKALASLLLQPSSHGVSNFSLIRRAAVDLLGRGFVVWELYLDVSSILIGLLELCIDGDKLVPSMTFGLPLTSRADACRTARHALALIATARPATFLITMVKEVARYNTMTQNAQSQQYHHSLHAAVLVKAKSEIVRVLELLIEKQPNDVVDHLSELTIIMVHCIDPNQVKTTGLQEVFPAYFRTFPMVSYCQATRRIAVGTKSGSLLFYDLKQGKCQTILAHGGPIHAASFSPDGKSLASYSLVDNKLLFWQTAASSLFSLGSHQIKCIKSFTTHSIEIPPAVNLLKNISVHWHDNRTVGLQLWDKMESRFRL